MIENIKIRLYNYRSIPYNSPVEFEIKAGINFILGLNNIGKSNVLRFLYDFKIIWQKFSNLSLNHANNQRFNIQIPYDNLKNQDSLEKEIGVSIETEDVLINLEIRPQEYELHTTELIFFYEIMYNKKDGSLELVNEIGAILKQCFYIGAFRSAHATFLGMTYDTAIGSNFLNSWKSWSTGQVLERRAKIKRLTAELAELFGYKSMEIQLTESANNLIVNCDNGSFLLNELGDGIAHFVIVLTNVMIAEPTIILIDEPETGLHPRMQELFLRALASKAKYGVLATSHSIGLARSVADNIYSLTKSEKGIKMMPYGKHHRLTLSQSIIEMGYSQHAEIGGNNILLVEGRTDVKSFREILRKYNIEKHFIVLSLGGTQFILEDKAKYIDELTEVKRFGTNVFVIFDSERTKANAPLLRKFENFSAVCSDLGFKVFSTEYHSTENYITDKALLAIIGDDKFQALDPYENPSERWTSSMKEKNWLMFREMTKEDFAGTKLQKFIMEEMAAKVEY